MSQGLDLVALRKMQGKLKNKAGQGEGLFIYSNKLPEDMDVRLLPTRDNMNGIFFLEQKGWWVNGKFYVVDEDNDVIDEEISMALEHPDLKQRAVLKALIEKKKDNTPLVKTEFRYLLPILQLNCKYNDDEELESFEVEGDEAKVLIAKPTLITAINEVVCSRVYQNKTKWGIMDREKGYNMIIGKTGKGLNTEYRAIGWVQSTEMDEKFYKEDKIPDVLEIHKKALKSEAYLRSVIRHYLYGEDLMKEEETEETSQEDVKDSKNTAKATSSASESGKPKRPSLGASAKEETAKSTSGKGRSLMDDVEAGLNDLDD